MELKKFKKRFEDIQKGSKVEFTKEEKTFIENEYHKKTGHHAPKNCGSCTYTYKILLNIINANKEKEVSKDKMIVGETNKATPKKKTTPKKKEVEK